ncbi:hypothetical protein C3747_89g745c [Trypanosoma cruzi]|uniref:Prefoldin subunit n=2 Tax=Trypanosoma cruzi TaxID=5693 RepID=Q4CTB4_TRYCC|nr:hypothetical protein, conserved [Trypanosoma cruzi]EAN83518.1 hypothetical protein, conserved [Trypanosoma cruzi]PWV08505.1 hypothetical protein C3747_89g745c [Trypanosoma cruzi]RNC49436.1 hypothetical protein TcCL_NonESM00663 [Trypanosoma cruzi]|eukprot:XP_805369.1 hypothetical protein [Trypanosoma cruzi strain CL Brener]
MAALVEAERMEREKALVEAQQRVNMLRETVRVMANRQVALMSNKRRLDISTNELTRLSADHCVYESVGRVFLRTPVNALIEKQTAQAESCEAEGTRLSNEKQRVTEQLKKEEAQLREAAETYVAEMNARQRQRQ